MPMSDAPPTIMTKNQAMALKHLTAKDLLFIDVISTRAGTKKTNSKSSMFSLFVFCHHDT
jgi:hypothetical protein